MKWSAKKNWHKNSSFSLVPRFQKLVESFFPFSEIDFHDEKVLFNLKTNEIDRSLNIRIFCCRCRSYYVFFVKWFNIFTLQTF